MSRGRRGSAFLAIVLADDPLFGALIFRSSALDLREGS